MSETNGVLTDWQLPGDDAPVVQGYPLLRVSYVVTVADMLRELGVAGPGAELRRRLMMGESVGGGGRDRETACAWTLASMHPGYQARRDDDLDAAWSGRWVVPAWAKERGQRLLLAAGA